MASATICDVCGKIVKGQVTLEEVSENTLTTATIKFKDETADYCLQCRNKCFNKAGLELHHKYKRKSHGNN